MIIITTMINDLESWFTPSPPRQTQFIVVCIHSAQLFYMECNYPIVFTYWIALYAVIFLVLFLNFYVQSYKRPPKQQRQFKLGDGLHNANGFKKLEWRSVASGLRPVGGRGLNVTRWSLSVGPIVLRILWSVFKVRRSFPMSRASLLFFPLVVVL